MPDARYRRAICAATRGAVLADQRRAPAAAGAKLAAAVRAAAVRGSLDLPCEPAGAQGAAPNAARAGGGTASGRRTLNVNPIVNPAPRGRINKGT